MRQRACPICKHGDCANIVYRERVPVHQNLLMNSLAAARSAQRGTLAMDACRNCGFVFNVAFDASLLRYGSEYDNNQNCSSTFSKHVDELIHHLLVERGVTHSNIVEVGCGQGQFIRRLVDEGIGNSGTGFDPSYAGPAEDPHGKLAFKRSYYDQTCAYITADVVICRHVIEHVQNPLMLLQAVRAALSNSPRARVFFETPCVEWILRNYVIWDFFYEHCSLFSPASLGAAFELAGFSVTSISHVFNGQYLWLEATLDGDAAEPRYNPNVVLDLAAGYVKKAADILAWRQEQLQGLRSRGGVGLWGAGAKGVTFANLLDPDAAILDCVVDLNPSKQGRFIAGTGHEIISYRDLLHRDVRSLILMNPNYRGENAILLRDAGLDTQLIE